MTEPPSKENKLWKGVFAVIGIMSTLVIYGVLQVHSQSICLVLGFLIYQFETTLLDSVYRAHDFGLYNHERNKELCSGFIFVFVLRVFD